MALTICSECQGSVSDRAAACPHCGAPISSETSEPPIKVPAENETVQQPKKKGGIWKWVLGVPLGAFLLLMLIGSCAGNSPEGKEKSASRNAIDYCWKEQSRKSFDPSTARFVASTCEKMEQDFRNKWGVSP